MEGERGSRQQLGVLVEQQRETPAGAAQELGVVESLAPSVGQCDRLVHRRMRERRLRRAVARAVVEDEYLGPEREARALARECVESAHEQLALGGAHDAVGQLDVVGPGARSAA